jgi:tetratricopeptide (TPR) repeat protein
MSDKPRFSDFEDDATVMDANIIDSHPANTNPFEQQSDPSNERTMVAEGPDLSDQATMVHDSLANPLAHIGKLFVQEGVNKDKTYPLLGEEVSFGREKDNAISHPDLSVSRRHFKIHVKNDKFTLEDLGSSSGTLVNGKRVNGSIRLNHGDKIQVGKTLLIFQRTDQEGETAGGINPLFMGLGAALAIILIAAVALFILNKPNNTTKKKASQRRIIAKRTKPDKPKGLTPAQKLLQKGVRLAGGGSRLQAKSVFEQALRIAKKDSLTRLQANQLLQDTTADIEIANLLTKAEASYTSRNFKKAKTLVDQAEKKLYSNSTLAEQVWSLSFKIQLSLRGKGMASELKRAKKLYRRRKYQEALALLTNLQRAVDPNSSDLPKLIKLTKQVTTRIERIERRRKRRRRRRRRKVQPTKTAKTETKINIVPVAPPAPEISRGLLFFKRGDLTNAKTAFEKEGKSKQAAKISAFQKVFLDARSAYAVRNPTIAIPSLLQANEVDRFISGSKSVYTKLIKTMLADMFFVKGKQQMAMRNFSGFASAFAQFSRAVQYKPRHPSSRSAIKKLRELAGGWLARAKKLGKSHEGRRLLNNVQRVVFRTDPLYKEAATLLKK